MNLIAISFVKKQKIVDPGLITLQGNLSFLSKKLLLFTKEYYIHRIPPREYSIILAIRKENKSNFFVKKFREIAKYLTKNFK